MSLRDVLKKSSFDGVGKFKHARVYLAPQVPVLTADGEPVFEEGDEVVNAVDGSIGHTRGAPKMKECGVGPFVEVREPSAGTMTRIMSNAKGDNIRGSVLIAISQTFAPSIVEAEKNEAVDDPDFSKPETWRHIPLQSSERIWDDDDESLLLALPMSQFDFVNRCATAASRLIAGAEEQKKL